MDNENVLASGDVKSASFSFSAGSIPYCPIDMESVTIERCKELTSDPAYNHRCVSHTECTSKYKGCPICLKYGDIKAMGHIEPVCCERGKKTCKDHRIYGEFRRGNSERAEVVKAFEVELEKRKQMASAIVPQVSSGSKNAKPFAILNLGEARKQSTAHQVKQAAEKTKSTNGASLDVPAIPQKEEPVPNAANVEVKVVEATPPSFISEQAEQTQSEISLPEIATHTEETEVCAAVAESFDSAAEKLEVGSIIQIGEVNDEGVVNELEVEVVSGVFDALWAEIKPYKEQPRKKFNSLQLEQLAGSIQEEGQLMPLLLCRLENDEYKWELVDGERRYRACQMIGKESMIAIVVEIKNKEDHYRKSVTANFCRVGHTPLEEADVIRTLLSYGDSKTKIARLLGKSVSWLNMRLALFNLHPELLKMLDKELSVTIAEYIAEIKDQDLQLSTAKEILNRKLGTEQAYLFVRKVMENIGQKSSKKHNPVDDYRKLKSLIRKTKSGIEHFSTMDEKAIWELFRRRQDSDRQVVLDDVKELIQQIKQLHQLLIWM